MVERAGIEPGEVENVIAGCVMQFGPQGLHVGRNAWLQNGFPIETSATTIDLQCGSAQQAVNLAASQVASGVHDVVIGGGVEHMGKLPFAASMKTQEDFGFAFTPELMEKHKIVGQGLGAEMIAEEYEIPRPELDELALRSHQLAHQATEEGRFEREMIPMQVNGDTYVTDQGIRPDTSLEALSQLKTVFKEDGVITAGNSSQISDGAAAVLLTTPEKASELGLTPARADRRPDDRRLRPGEDARGADPGHEEDPRAQRDHDGRHRPVRDQRGVRARWSRPGAGSTTRTWTA